MVKYNQLKNLILDKMAKKKEEKKVIYEQSDIDHVVEKLTLTNEHPFERERRLLREEKARLEQLK
jgi:hypothetical protein